MQRLCNGWRREGANKLMSFGDLEPANLYSETVLRKAKQLDIDEKLGKISGKISAKFPILLPQFYN